MNYIVENQYDTVNNAWLGLGDISKLIRINPLAGVKLENIGLDLIKLMRQPEYLSFAAKLLLNIDLLPMQSAIIEELWTHPFPMFVASRGYGKTHRDTYVITDSGFVFINDLFKDTDPYEQKIPLNLSLLGETGFRGLEYGWKKRPDRTIKLKTRHGFEIEGSPEHPIRVVDNGKIIWKELSKLKLSDRVVIVRDTQWFKNTNNITLDMAYLFGCLVGDGGYTKRGQISFTTRDVEFLDNINLTTKKLWNKEFHKSKTSKYSYYIYGVDIWDELFQKYGFNSSVCELKDIPKSILSASKESVAACLSGLFDTDGHVKKKSLWIEYCSKSKQLVRSIQFLLTRFGIISNLKIKLNKKYNRYYYYLYIWGDNVKLFYHDIGFKLKRKQDRLKSLLDIITNTNLDTIPHTLILDDLLKLKELFKKDSGFVGHGYNYQRQLISPYRLKKYEMSYDTLKKILDIFANSKLCKSSKEYLKLLEIYNTHYFYDSVTVLSEGYNELYDFYISNDHSYFSGGFISHNSWLLAVYALLKCALYPGTKIVICGAAFRQSKIIFDYMDQIWANAHILRSIGDNNSGAHRDVDRCTFFVNDSWAIAIPIGNGDKIRGLRAHTIIADEFSAIPVDIYETVIAGFAAVSANPIENVREAAAKEAMSKMGIFTADAEYKYDPSKQNQAIISGTADYSFKNFANYWRRYKAIIESGGNVDILTEILGDNLTDNFDYRDYSVIRVPYELIPPGFMDDKVVSRAKATGHSAMYMMEYGCVFVDDSDGFFKRTLVESCVADDKNIRKSGWPTWCPAGFDVVLRGDVNKQYVFGVDPASERDNFAIKILEVHNEHSRVVYGWSTTRQDFKKKHSRGGIKEHDFYSFCARKIRDLMKLFPCKRIGLDAQGGGIAVAEALQDPKNLEEGEIVILPVIEEDKEKDTDLLPGLHILEMCQFVRAEWTAEANHSLRKAFEDKTLLLPRFDTITLELAIANDKLSVNELSYDTLEDCVLEIEALKDELCTITMSRTGTGVNSRDRWDTPEIKLAGGKKGRLRKDRYSALLMAYMMAKQIQNAPPPTIYSAVGGVAKGAVKSKGGQMYVGPDWFISEANQMFDGFTAIHK